MISVASGSGSATIPNSNTIRALINSSRKLNMKITNEETASTEMFAYGYRRIGSNV